MTACATQTADANVFLNGDGGGFKGCTGNSCAAIHSVLIRSTLLLVYA